MRQWNEPLFKNDIKIIFRDLNRKANYPTSGTRNVYWSWFVWKEAHTGMLVGTLEINYALETTSTPSNRFFLLSSTFYDWILALVNVLPWRYRSLNMVACSNFNDNSSDAGKIGGTLGNTLFPLVCWRCYTLTQISVNLPDAWRHLENRYQTKY